jgi:hypothetical protein
VSDALVYGKKRFSQAPVGIIEVGVTEKLNHPAHLKRLALYCGAALLPVLALLAGCTDDARSYESFAQWPGFEEYYADRCTDNYAVAGNGLRSPYAETTEREKLILIRYRPRIVLPPGGHSPIDFYRDYLPHTVLKNYPEKKTIHGQVTSAVLRNYQHDLRYYLEFDEEAFLENRLHVDSSGGEQPAEPLPGVVYGRVYEERVPFYEDDGSTVHLDLMFLKYNVVFAVSGLVAKLPPLYEPALRLAGFDLNNWHDLDNFVAVHVVLLDEDTPVAVILSQHNHHRTYLLGKDMAMPEDGRLAFDIALRSNEIYPASESSEAVLHRTVQWSIGLKYLLSGEDPPLLRGYDVTMGVGAGGKEIDYELLFISPCDPLYTAKMLLGEPRPFMGLYIGRDGPPGSDYYQLPELLPLGNLLRFYYLQDGDREDIDVVERAIDRRKKTIDTEMLLIHGGKSFLQDLRELHDLSVYALTRPR